MTQYPFEIHLTVPHTGDKTFNDSFANVCRQVGVKPLMVDLDGVAIDVMTSESFMGTYEIAVERSKEVMSLLEAHGFEIIRVKIETSPDNPECLNITPEQYFESHLAVIVPDLQSDKHLRTISENNGCHTSSNAFKIYPNYKVIMVTKRDADCTVLDFIEKVNHIHRVIEESGFEVGTPIIEFVIYDSNKSHDDLWISQLQN